MSELNDVVLGNRYIIQEKIGEGGMALVFKARCQLLNRFVAVKILRPEFTHDEEFIKKFKRESLAAASLSHPNIVGIYDVGEQEGIYYIVMEYVSGKTLKEYIRDNGKLNYRETLNIANQIANALEHVHRNGVVHRDIKPQNILVTDDKIIKVTDFGIARASNSATIANTGSVMGSVHYFSPEQARGGYSDHRTDIYSLGVVIYEILTGSLPYDAESPVTVALKHIQEDFIEPTIVDNSVPAAINDIVKKAMEKDMANRYQSIKELIDDIEIARNNPYQRISHSSDVNQFTQTIEISKIDEALNNSKKVNKKKKRIKIAIITTASILALILIAFISKWAFNKYFDVKDVTVPHIIGMQEEAGKKLLEENKLVFAEGVRQSSDKPVGEILKVSPYEGAVVKENSTVTVIVSSGAEQVVVPDLANRTESDAEMLLTQNKLTKGTVTHKNSDTIAKDMIMSQEPAPNSSADKGSAVNIVISDGPLVKLTKVPVITGMTLDNAIIELAKYKLKLGKVTYDENPIFIDNVIIALNIQEDTQVPEGQEIDVTVNKTSSSNTGGNNSGNNGNTNTNTPPQ